MAKLETKIDFEETKSDLDDIAQASEFVPPNIATMPSSNPPLSFQATSPQIDNTELRLYQFLSFIFAMQESSVITKERKERIVSQVLSAWHKSSNKKTFGEFDGLHFKL